jgi:type II secretory pathway pseudopilin PulG
MVLNNTGGVCKMRRNHRFTLIELLVTITVIVILSGLTIAGVRFAFQRSEEASIKSRFQKLQMALEDYRRDWGYYPVWPHPPHTAVKDFQTDSKFDLAFSLWSPPGDLGTAGQIDPGDGRPYIEEHTGSGAYRQTKGGPAFRYQYPGANNPQSYDLVAAGVDETFSQDKDNFNNWESDRE